ncbi:uncharacterized protein [Clytia hemisphaerica]|uniref:CUB domain-containing protein n=1 Tax=Clytia hemisphaerica TaxID=252671 RepID=A0A7M5UHD8_9CNID
MQTKMSLNVVLRFLLLTSITAVTGGQTYLNSRSDVIQFDDTKLKTESSPKVWRLERQGTLQTLIELFHFNLSCNKDITLQLCNIPLNSGECFNLCGPKYEQERYTIWMKGSWELRLDWTKNVPGFYLNMKYQLQCEPGYCGNEIRLPVDGSKLIRKPNDLQDYYCDCDWHISVEDDNYYIRAEFLQLKLPPSCVDYIDFEDPESQDTSGPHCGTELTSYTTSQNKLIIRFKSRDGATTNGFEILLTSKKKEGDLEGLQSVAAVLGAISFGVFVGLMLCSVLYKRWSRGRPTNDVEENIEEGNENDVDDAIQRAAPPSYNKVLAAPEDYPSTPQASPIMSRSPHLPTVLPPKYPGKDNEHDISRRNSANIEMATLPLPTTPSYDVVSESEDEWFPVQTSPSTRSRSRSKLVGENGNPPSYLAVTSEGSEAENHAAEANSPTPLNDTRNKNRASRSKRTSLSTIHKAHRTLSHSDSDEETEESDHENRRKRSGLTIPGLEPGTSGLAPINSDSEGEQASTSPRRKRPPSLLEVPGVDFYPERDLDRLSPEIRRHGSAKERSYSDLARHAICNSIARSPISSPDFSGNRRTRLRSEEGVSPSHANETVNVDSVHHTNSPS